MSDDRVLGDVGGWISGPALDDDQLATRQLGGPRYGVNVGAWMKDYGPRYLLSGGFEGFGFICWRRGGDGRRSGKRIVARTLDDLAETIDHRED